MMAPCPNEGCSKDILQDDLKKHLERCAFRKMPCTMCRDPVVVSLFAEHCATLCPKRSVTCDQCSAAIFADEKQSHDDFMCKGRTGGDGCAVSQDSADQGTLDDEKQMLRNELYRCEREMSKMRTDMGTAMRHILALKSIQEKQERMLAALLQKTPLSYVWCLEPYKKLRQESIMHKEDLLSEPIFFGIPGCKFRLQANLYGIGRGAGTHMAFFVQWKATDVRRMDRCENREVRCLIRVATQTKQKENVDFSFSFSADANDNRRSLSRPLHMWNTLFGREKFIAFEDLENVGNGYVAHDVLLLEFHVID